MFPLDAAAWQGRMEDSLSHLKALAECEDGARAWLVALAALAVACEATRRGSLVSAMGQLTSAPNESPCV